MCSVTEKEGGCHRACDRECDRECERSDWKRMVTKVVAERYFREIIDTRMDLIDATFLDVTKMRNTVDNLFDPRVYERTAAARLIIIQYLSAGRVLYYEPYTHPWISIPKKSSAKDFLRSLARCVLSDKDLERFSPAVVLSFPTHHKDLDLCYDPTTRLSTSQLNRWDTFYLNSQEQSIEFSMPYDRKGFVFSLEDRERNESLDFLVQLMNYSRKSFVEWFLESEQLYSYHHNRFQKISIRRDPVHKVCLFNDKHLEQLIEDEFCILSAPASDVELHCAVDAADPCVSNTYPSDSCVTRVETKSKFFESDDEDESDRNETLLRRRNRDLCLDTPLGCCAQDF